MKFGIFFQRDSGLWQWLTFSVNLLFFLLLLLEFFFPQNAYLRIAEFFFGLMFTAEFVGAYRQAVNKLKYILSLYSVFDLIVIIIIVYRMFVFDSDLLHLISSLRIFRAYRVARSLPSATFMRHRDVILASLNLVVFVFIMTSVVFVFQNETNASINTYIDALYFTVATLTTTGFGDITAVGDAGKMLASGIMIFGAALFFKLAASIFRPQKVRHHCDYCGLTRHDFDASHCKHCGQVIKIRFRGNEII